MNRGRIAFMAAALVASWSLAPIAANSQPSDRVWRQAAGLERVLGVSGEWQLSRYQWDEQRNDWSTAPAEPNAGSITFRRMDHGKAFRVYIGSPRYQLEGYFTFDVWTDRYVLAVIDDTNGQLDVGQGTFVGDRLVLDNLRAGTFYKRATLPTHSRTTLQFVGGKLKTFQVEYSQDQGQSWKRNSLFRVQAIEATRKRAM